MPTALCSDSSRTPSRRRGKLKETERQFPWDRVELHHVKDLLELLLPEARVTNARFEFDYDRAAAAYLLRRDVDSIQPRCHAMFIDERRTWGRTR